MRRQHLPQIPDNAFLCNQATRTLRVASELRNAVEHERLPEVNCQSRLLAFTHIVSRIENFPR